MDPQRVEVRIPADIESEEELFAILDEGLSLPDYFGRNWNALVECIRDLSWLPPGQVVLIHEDVPLRNNRENQMTYLSILGDAVARWKDSAHRDFLVTFPKSYEGEVQQLL